MADRYPNKKLFNIAADIEINQYIHYTMLPEGGLTLDTFSDLNLDERAGTDYYYKKLEETIDCNGNSSCSQLQGILDQMDGESQYCHKHWEALYLNSIPIVSSGINVNYFKNKQIPFLILDSWSELNNIKLSPELHEKIWGNFDSDTLLFDNYLMNLQIGEF